PLLEAALRSEQRERARIVVRNRIVQGPLRDALACAPLLGTGDWVGEPANAEASARLEILLWEAGARALELPDLGRWIWDSEKTFEAVVATPARGSLRGRVLAARCLEVAAGGMTAMTDPQLVGRTLQVLQPLLLHPEPIVWIHAARAFGRLAGAFEPLEGTLLDWVHGATLVLRQRALTAFASLPSRRLGFLGHELESILDSPEEAAWGLAAAAAATPYLFHERRDLWDRLADRITAGDGGAVAARALAKGLATLWRRGEDREEIEPTLRDLRQSARRAEGESVDDWRRWLDTLGATDPVEDAERDPLDLEMGLENLIRLAAFYDDEEADARAARFARSLGPTLDEARRVALGEGSVRHRAAGFNAIEGCARSLALRLWGPMLATRPSGDGISEPDLEATWEMVARMPAELLEVVRELRTTDERDEPRYEVALEVLAIKLGGYTLDACGEERTHLRGQTAHDTCLMLRKLDGLVDGSRELPGSLQSALSALFWRLVDTTRGTSLGEVDDVEWLGPFAAWWALVIDRPAVLQQLANALPMIAEGALETCIGLAEELRELLSGEQEEGRWGDEAKAKLAELRADGTELGEALDGLARSLGRFADAAGPRPDLEALCLELVMAAERLQSALADPVRALHPASEQPIDDSLTERTSVNAPRMASIVQRAIRARDLTLLEVWFASLGPTAAALVEAAVKAAVKRTPPPPPTPKKKQPKMVVGYELVKPLGEGGIGSVWLVRKPGADRFFVLKIPKRDVLENASDTEREGILASFVDEARALAGLYHPNVANIIDRGVADDMPYLVLEYLIGADLKQYSEPRKMTLFELGKVVPEACAGLTALHNAGLVHRDIKPANLWLRLPLAGGVRFDPEKHRDPAQAQPLSTVIIDFGMVRAQKVSAEVGGRFVAGTPGYIAPEQVLDPVELDGRADVYALAGTIYNVTTGRTFFDEIEDKRERIVAHMRRDPMEDASRFEQWPAALQKLMRAATAMDWKDRPTPLEFGKAFQEAL
ncbi:MAG TPA: serine/threonine-protein kinase, partial [Polyangiaceae bacterium LLY-WYZ-15_(1-7)]|nr:serine/threonine-protein kinase [Polyangiaceae bacterium LLY-WYZ-15_(1-7)]